MMLSSGPEGDFHGEAEDVYNRWFEVLLQERVQYNDICANEA